MSAAARSVLAFGVYIVAAGLLLLLAPNALLGVLGLPATDEVWIRTVGAIAVALGLYYVQAGRHELVPFFEASIVGRLWFAVSVTVLAVVWQTPQLLIFAAIDALGAAWTGWLLRSSQGSSSK